MSERWVKCPRCGRMVDVPTTGEKVHCPGCGQKFRFDLPPLSDETLAVEPPEAKPSEEQATAQRGPPPLPETKEVRCPHCAWMVRVPTTGEKVHCPGCGQKFRFDGPAPSDEPAKAEPSVQEAPKQEAAAEPAAPPPLPEAREVRCPDCGQMVQVPSTGEKVRCPGCGRKFRFEAPAAPEKAGPEPPKEEEAAPPAEAPERPAPTPAEAEELRTLWPSLRALITRLYEEAALTDEGRLFFRMQADRAAALAAKFLPPPGPDGSQAHVFCTSVLSRITLDEILGLSLEDYRQLNETLDDAQELIEERLPRKPQLPSPQAAPFPVQRPARTAPVAQRRSSVPLIQTIVGLLAVAVLAAVLLFLPRILDAIEGRRLDDTPPRGKRKLAEPKASTAETARPSETPPVKTPTPKPTTGLSAIQIPSFEPPETRTPEPKTTPPEVKEPPQPQVKRVFSRWQAGPDGWITLFNGKNLDGLSGDPTKWFVRDAALYGIEEAAAATLVVPEADWTDYNLAMEAKLAATGALVVAHGDLTARISNGHSRLSNPQRVLDECAKGLTRKKWYRIELDVKGRRAEVRVNDRTLLVTSAHAPTPGGPTLEVQQGGVAVRTLRLRLHESDPNYRAVALREGYLVPVSPPSTSEPPTVRLGPGTHRLFNGVDLTGWTQVGDWSVKGGVLVGRAPLGERAVLAAGSPEWQDYTLSARCRLTRQGRIPRDGEYFLLIVRYQSSGSFYCVRFPIEGIFESGYCYRGRFHEGGRGRHGLGNRFNEWRDIQVSMRGDKLTLVIDNNPYPAWTLKGLGRGGIALGVEGGEAAFTNVRAHVLR